MANSYSGQSQGTELPMAQPRAVELPTAERSGQTYLIEGKDGFLTRVPEDKLESWQKAQRERGDAPLSRAEQQLKDRIVQMLYGKKK